MRKFGDKEKMFMQTVLATMSMPKGDSDEGEVAREVQHDSRQHKIKKIRTVDSGLQPTGYINWHHTQKL